MTNTTKPAAQEIDPATLDQIAGGAKGIVLHDARQQEQSDKLNSEEAEKTA